MVFSAVILLIPEPRKEEHVLQVHGNLGLPPQVQEERQRVDVERSPDHDGEERSENEASVEPVIEW